MADKYVAYVGTYTHENSVGIYVYDLDPDTGILKERSVAPINNPSYLCASYDGKYLYSIADEGVAAFSIDENGDLIFMSRKDFQIKHMGHRIELGEIEAVVHAKEGIERACCLFDDVKKKIILYYVGDLTKADMVLYIKDKLPRYMVPNYVEKLDKMPLTPNGKINRVLLKEKYDSK